MILSESWTAAFISDACSEDIYCLYKTSTYILRVQLENKNWSRYSYLSEFIVYLRKQFSMQIQTNFTPLLFLFKSMWLHWGENIRRELETSSSRSIGVVWCWMEAFQNFRFLPTQNPHYFILLSFIYSPKTAVEWQNMNYEHESVRRRTQKGSSVFKKEIVSF